MCSTASFWERGLSLWFEICRAWNVLKPFQLSFAAETNECVMCVMFSATPKRCAHKSLALALHPPQNIAVWNKEMKYCGFETNPPVDTGIPEILRLGSW